jgi:hypothetical protein
MRLAGSLLACAAVACGGDDGPPGMTIDAPPAATDGPTADVPEVAGDFSCATTPWPTNAADPLAVIGRVVDPIAMSNIGNAAVEIRRKSDGMLLVSGNASGTGVFAFNLATGGNAQAIVRKATLAGRLDAYTYDPFAIHDATTATRNIPSLTAAELDGWYQTAGVTRDAARGTILVEVLDCAGLAVIGTTATTTGAQRALYFDDFMAPDAAATTTSASGMVALLNVPAATSAEVTITAGSRTYRAWPVGSVAGAFTSSTRYP